jgi:hypothetical protein
MTDETRAVETDDDPFLILAEAILELARAVRSAPPPVIQVTAAEQLAPIVNVTTPEVRVAVPEQRAPVVQMPVVQEVRIVGLPKLAAKVKRDKAGRIESIEE